MKACFLFLVLSACGLLVSCSTETERKPVGPQGSDVSSMPWNNPQPGEGQGLLGNMLNRY